MSLKVGDDAPDFDLEAATGERTHRVRLSDYRGRQNVVIVFHPLDWTPT
jgi:peroxiredoxin